MPSSPHSSEAWAECAEPVPSKKAKKGDAMSESEILKDAAAHLFFGCFRPVGLSCVPVLL